MSVTTGTLIAAAAGPLGAAVGGLLAGRQQRSAQVEIPDDIVR